MYLLDTITTPRFYHFQNFSETELYLFGDASVLAYAAVAYYRIISIFDIKVSLIIAKFRSAPLQEKYLTIHNLELQAASTASRL